MSENPFLQSTYRGEGHVRQPGCTLLAHCRQVQLLSDAMEFAAQVELAAAVEQWESLKGAIVGRKVIGTRFALELADAQHMVGVAYGKWLGAKGFHRLAEGSTYDCTPTELDMLARVNWDAETFEFPGKEAFPPVAEQHLPGAEAEG